MRVITARKSAQPRTEINAESTALAAVFPQHIQAAAPNGAMLMMMRPETEESSQTPTAQGPDSGVKIWSFEKSFKKSFDQSVMDV